MHTERHYVENNDDMKSKFYTDRLSLSYIPAILASELISSASIQAGQHALVPVVDQVLTRGAHTDRSPAILGVA